VIATGESGLSVVEVVAIYKDLSDVEIFHLDHRSSAGLYVERLAA
jgi:hypothetical protein